MNAAVLWGPAFGHHPEGGFRANLRGDAAYFLNPVFGRTGLLHRLLRLGLAGIFISNSIGAWYDTSSYMDLLRTSFMGRVIADLRPWVEFIKLNDLVVGLLVLSGLWHKYVLAWAGLWLIVSTIIRLSATFFPWV